ncbi:hypothetical protein D3C71_1483020 [compost metagenome]
MQQVAKLNDADKRFILRSVECSARSLCSLELVHGAPQASHRSNLKKSSGFGGLDLSSKGVAKGAWRLPNIKSNRPGFVADGLLIGHDDLRDCYHRTAAGLLSV